MRKLLLIVFLITTLGVSAQENKIKKTVVVYKKVDNIELKMNIFEPSKQASSKAAMVLIHGGGWNSGKPEAMQRHAMHFCNRGLVVFTPEYRVRKRNNTTIVEAVEDAKSAVAWVKAHAKEYNFDPNALIVGGGSAGAHLATSTIMLDGVGEQNPKQDYKPSCLVLFNPVLDVSKEGYGHNKVKNELKPYGLTWQQLSPMEHITKGLPPMIVLVGDKDKVLKKHVAQKFEKRMKDKGNDFTLKLYPGAEHTFFNFGYGNKQGYPKGTINKYYYEVLQATDDFLVKHKYLDGNTTVKIPKGAVYPIRKE